jgi:cytochrome-b5 reductase
MHASRVQQRGYIEVYPRSVAFKVRYEPNRWEHVGLIAGGTGFTPMLQVIHHAMQGGTDRKGNVDRTKLSFLYCNRTENHILLRGVFERLAREHPDRFTLGMSVDKPLHPETWKGYTGYLTEKMVRDHMPPPSLKEKAVVLLCGPDLLMHHAAGVPTGASSQLSGGANIQPLAPDLANLTGLSGVLGAVGYSDDQVFRF